MAKTTSTALALILALAAAPLLAQTTEEAPTDGEAVVADEAANSDLAMGVGERGHSLSRSSTACVATDLPSIYFVAPRVTIATTPRVPNPVAAPLAPHLLWSADTLAAMR